jgi:hypothetical protein
MTGSDPTLGRFAMVMALIAIVISVTLLVTMR